MCQSFHLNPPTTGRQMEGSLDPLPLNTCLRHSQFLSVERDLVLKVDLVPLLIESPLCWTNYRICRLLE